MAVPSQQTRNSLREFRLFLEEICCNLCRFQHLYQDDHSPESIKINQEVYLGMPDAFADIRVQPSDDSAYFIEVKYGYPILRLLSSLERKYGKHSHALMGASKLILVVEPNHYDNWDDVKSTIQSQLHPSLKLEVWNEDYLMALIKDTFGVHLDSFSEANLLDLRAAIDDAKGMYAFGEKNWNNDSLQSSLLWQFGFWKLRQLCETRNVVPREMVPPGLYQDVVVLMVDLCAYSSYVRDTWDDEVVRHVLTSFYSKVRYEILNTGGMLFESVGDQVNALFGMPEPIPSSCQDALDCARALIDIGNSVSTTWQRHIDRVQHSRGVHIGMAIGDIQVVSLRPYGRAHLGAVSDALNMAARLQDQAGSGEIVISNSYYQSLPERSKDGFEALEAIDAKNMGKINAWKLRVHPE
ncbi:adenylate/guanylate cyclase domain-containing protein [Candidatus Entotheonella palauensis]|uniref:adenylate/guanylate cyclase domain-containing protein n=1 Tax=Candidatus Entotheonella palauensis TaxID=93172 RepID=UPI000B7D2666|nr:adenylate/guanylate cyclase domain-containing protein [Candidatus Entotheonella palauensis]